MGLFCCAGLANALAGEAIEADGTTALHRAIYAGDVAAVRQLVAAGADPRAANLFGATPMMLAASRGEAAVIRVLLDAGVNPDSPNAEGQTALMAVARTGNRRSRAPAVAAGRECACARILGRAERR